MKKMKRFLYITIIIELVVCITLKVSFSGEMKQQKDVITQGDILDLTVNTVGLSFFIPKKGKHITNRDLFEFKKKIASMHYPVLKRVKKNKPADCCFLGKVVYQIVTSSEERKTISCSGIIHSLQSKGYAITCRAGEIVDKPTALTLFRDPKFLKDVMETVDTVKSSPYSTKLSESYSTPGSKAR